MIVVRVELHSAITHQVTELARMHICNDGQASSDNPLRSSPSIMVEISKWPPIFAGIVTNAAHGNVTHDSFSEVAIDLPSMTVPFTTVTPGWAL